MKAIRLLTIIIVTLLISCRKDDIKSPFVPVELLLMNEVILHENTDDPDKKMGFSIFYPSDEIPKNWVSPVNFKEGDVYFRLSVLSKPDNRKIYYQMGFQWEGGCNGNRFKEKFPGQRLLEVESPGIYTASLSLTDFWEPDCQTNDPINWSQGIERLLVVVWDENFHQIDDRWGYGGNIENIDGYFPMEVHFQAVVVPKGLVFAGWDKYSISLSE